jgi:GT2 family glycosyltransferase
LYASRPGVINMFGGELSRIGLGWDANEGQPSASCQSPQERLWAPSSALMVRRDVVERIGSFDETFYFGFEDSDFGWRANLAGIRCICLPHLLALHHATPSARTAGRTIVFHYAKNRLRSMLKNYSPASLATYVSLYLLYCAAEVVARPSRGARMQALAWNLVALRDTWRERARVQRLRRRSDAELFRYFSVRLLPATTLARRRRDEWSLLRPSGHRPTAGAPLRAFHPSIDNSTLGEWGTE